MVYMACEVTDIKILLLGANKVGKSSLIRYFGNKTFSASYMPTRLVDFIFKNIFLNKTPYRIQVWHVRHSLMNFCLKYPESFRAYVFVFDVMQKSSLAYVEDYLGYLSEIINNDRNAVNSNTVTAEKYLPYPIVLIGNKCDREEDREISYQEGRIFAEQNGIKYYIETSCKTGENVERAIIQAAAYAVQWSEKHYVPYQDCILTNKQKTSATFESNSCIVM